MVTLDALCGDVRRLGSKIRQFRFFASFSPSRFSFAGGIRVEPAVEMPSDILPHHTRLTYQWRVCGTGCMPFHTPPESICGDADHGFAIRSGAICWFTIRICCSEQNRRKTVTHSYGTRAQ